MRKRCLSIWHNRPLRLSIWGLTCWVSFLLIACQSSPPPVGDTLFTRLPSDYTGISFQNHVEQTDQFNIFSYRNFYNGGGVAVGDINQDGLPDIYFTKNMGRNALYLNKGNFQFEDITESAGVGSAQKWSTGVVMVDINGDGLLDIYVCNAGFIEGTDQRNELYINQGDLTFKEAAADYGLDQNGYTTHAAFFDYDQDGDLDVYILNNSFMPVNTLNFSNNRELYAEDWPVKDFLKGGGDKLFRNDAGKYVDVTKEAGIYGSLIGFGLGITVGDVNGDHLLDMYVSNDFYERDYIYLNQGDGTFKEDMKNWMQHTSLFSMGADMADINNDGYPEIFVTDMLPGDEKRLKETTEFESYQIYQEKLRRDFYYQYMHNALQYNNGDQTFSEIAQYSGVEASDWSWGALMFDADNDGFRDLYVCNGILQDVTNQDFINFFANEVVQKMVLTGKKEEKQKVIAKMPSNPIPNKTFHNNHDLTFSDKGDSWGLDIPSFSNGAAYADLDGDGDLDLVVNNLEQEAFVFRNNAEQLTDHHYLRIQLEGTPDNTYAIGSEINVYRKGDQLSTQLIPSRGFQSSIDYTMVFGLGTDSTIDSVVCLWPDMRKTVVLNPLIDTTLMLTYQGDLPAFKAKTLATTSQPYFTEVSHTIGPHAEDEYADFFHEGLIIRMLSREGPKAAIMPMDRNGIYVRDLLITAGAKNQPTGVWFDPIDAFSYPCAFNVDNDIRLDSAFEDTEVLVADLNRDGIYDLFIGSGGNEHRLGSKLMQDRIYLNEGKGCFIREEKALPVNGFNTSKALAKDIDQDGDQDLIVFSRSQPGNYGTNPRHFVYENDGTGHFKDIAPEVAKDFVRLGMVTDASWVDIDGDEQEELVVVGEWTSPQVFKLENGQLVLQESSLNGFSGWWYAVEAADLDGDGDQDLVLGNRGENFYFTGTAEAPAKLWIYDFDFNGTVEKIITRSLNGRDMPIPMKKELTEQVVSLKQQNLKHSEYADKAIQDLFSADRLSKAQVKEGNYFKSAIARNDGQGNFTLEALPREVQFSCVCGIECTDLNGDGIQDLVLAGNESGFMPQFSKLDASFGHVVISQPDGSYAYLPPSQSGFFVEGEVKQLIPYRFLGKDYIWALVNDQAPRLFRMDKE